jgi:pimeloyl-ACP methyl ester carboxylesterase
MNRQLLTVSIVFPLFSCAVFNRETPPLTDSSQAISTTRPVNLHSAALGKGRTLLFLHGFGANSYTWSKVSEALSQNYRVILLDLKGHGASPKPNDGAYSLHDQAELVTAFIMDNRLEDVTLIGHSLGGGVALLVALKLASRVPNPISSLILIDSVAYSQPLPSFIKLLRVPVLAQLSVCLVPNRLQTLQVLKLAYYDNNKITDETIEAYSAPLSLPGGHRALIETAKQIIPQDIEEISRRYGTIRIPTLVVWGKHDRIVPFEVAERLHRSIPNSDLVVIDGAGHVPQEETPAATLLAMQKFLQARP